MIGRFYDKTASVERLATVSGSKKAYASHIASLPCYVQPQDASISSDIEGGFGKNFALYCDTADIKEGDRIIIDTTEYRVMGIQSYETGSLAHMEIIIRHF